MKEEILISDIIKNVDELLLYLEVHFTIKNINKI